MQKAKGKGIPAFIKMSRMRGKNAAYRIKNILRVMHQAKTTDTEQGAPKEKGKKMSWIDWKKNGFDCFFCNERITAYPCCACGKGYKKKSHN